MEKQNSYDCGTERKSGIRRTVNQSRDVAMPMHSESRLYSLLLSDSVHAPKLISMEGSGLCIFTR